MILRPNQVSKGQTRFELCALVSYQAAVPSHQEIVCDTLAYNSHGYGCMDHTMVKSVLFLLWWINDNKQERETVSTRANLLTTGANHLESKPKEQMRDPVYILHLGSIYQLVYYTTW